MDFVKTLRQRYRQHDDNHRQDSEKYDTSVKWEALEQATTLGGLEDEQRVEAHAPLDQTIASLESKF